jgi:hypothetical protein
VTVPWCQVGLAMTGAPAVSMVDGEGTDAIVWLADIGGELFAIDGETSPFGVYLRHFPAGTVADISRHQSPIFSKGRVFIAGNSRLYTFRPAAP